MILLLLPSSAWLFRGFDVFGSSFLCCCVILHITMPTMHSPLIVLIFFLFFFSVLTYDRTEEDDSSLPHIDGGYAPRNSVLPPGILPHGMPQVKGKHCLQIFFLLFDFFLIFNFFKIFF